MAEYTLRRNSDGKLITTTSAVAANDLVANGVAKLVNRPSQPREEAQPKRRSAETK